MRKKEKLSAALKRAAAAEKAAALRAEKQVMIEKAINLRLMCDYAVSMSYGDLVLIIAMLHDYILLCDEVKGDNIQYQAYYRKKFQKIASRLEEQLGYDFEAAVEKCKAKKEEKYSDIGEEAVALTVSRGR